MAMSLVNRRWGTVTPSKQTADPSAPFGMTKSKTVVHLGMAVVDAQSPKKLNLDESESEKLRAFGARLSSACRHATGSHAGLTAGTH